MSYQFRAHRFPNSERASWRQLNAIYALQKRLGIRQTYDKRTTKKAASDLIASLTKRLGKQASLF